MKVSLVLTAYNRLEELDRFFSALAHTEMHNFSVEVIFVNQGEYSLKEDYRSVDGLTIHEVNVPGPIPLSTARNIGVKSISGDIVGFPDDDCWYSHHVLADVVDYFRKKTDLGALCVRVFDPILGKPYGNRPSGLRCAIGPHNAFRLPISVGIFVDRACFEAVGGNFDERLGVGSFLGSGEETDLIIRLILARIKVEYAGDLVVYHPSPEVGPDEYLKAFRYGLGYGFLNARVIRYKEWGFLGPFCGVLARSILGGIFFMFKGDVRRTYFYRFLGIVSGFRLGMKAPE